MSTSDQTIGKLTAELRKLKSSLNRDSTILLVLAVILFSVMLGYFIFGYNQFKKISEPTTLMDAAEAIVSENITEVRKHVQNEVKTNADVWAEQLSERAVQTVPDMRKNLENFVTSQIKEKVEESVKLSDPEFEKLLTENKEVLQKAFKDLGKDQKLSKEIVDIITTEVDNRLKTSVQADADNVLNMMIQLKAKMRKLSKGEGLNEEESLEREILKTARLIQESNED